MTTPPPPGTAQIDEARLVQWGTELVSCVNRAVLYFFVVNVISASALFLLVFLRYDGFDGELDGSVLGPIDGVIAYAFLIAMHVMGAIVSLIYLTVAAFIVNAVWSCVANCCCRPIARAAGPVPSHS